VLLEFEHTAMINADAFKNTVAIKQSVVENGYFRIALAVIFAVYKNFHEPTGGYQKIGRIKANLGDIFGALTE
jgi:hypothetical protein